MRDIELGGGRVATVAFSRNDDIWIYYKGFLASLRELEALRLHAQGYSSIEIGQKLCSGEGTVRNLLSAVKSRNDGRRDYHHMDVVDKANDLGLLRPLALLGLQTILDSNTSSRLHSTPKNRISGINATFQVSGTKLPPDMCLAAIRWPRRR